MKLTNRTAIVTGSSSGIGRAVASRLASLGAFVIVNARTSVKDGEQLVDDINTKGGQATFIQADVSTPDGVSHLFNELDRVSNRLDILVNNAGLTLAEDVVAPTIEHWDEMLRTNLMSCVLCCSEAIPRMQGNSYGRIVNTASIRGLRTHGRQGVAAYSAAKAAVINYTATLAHQVAPEILVNAVAPGFVETAYMGRVSNEQKEEWKRTIPIGRFISPEEISDVYELLSCTDIFCGEALVVDGGLTLGG